MNILVAEDDTTSRLILAAMLRKLGHAVTAVKSGQEAWQAARHSAPQLLISDWLMPDMNGLELCRKIRLLQGSHYTYVILLTSLAGKGRYLEGMDAGADDLITKPFDEDLLVARLHVAQRILALHDALRTQAMHDRLTGLLNRGAILDYLQSELARAARERVEIGLIIADLDHFKRINDTHGHPVGDAVLREAARRMSDAVRSYDRIGRYGGEEFLVVVPSGALASALPVAQRICDAIGNPSFTTEGGEIAVTVSVGVAVSSVGTEDQAGVLLAAADEALYRAKDEGRNRVVSAQRAGAEKAI